MFYRLGLYHGMNITMKCTTYHLFGRRFFGSLISSYPHLISRKNLRLKSEPDFHSVDVDLEFGEVVEYKFVEFGRHGSDVKWEDLGGEKNRTLKVDDKMEETFGKVVLLPVERFAEPGGSEGDHTARFYQGVKERGEISVRKVLNQLLGGGNSKIFFEIFTPRNDPI